MRWCPFIDEGGLALGDDRLVPKLLLCGRDAERLAAVARAHNVADWTTDLDTALADPAYAIFFDAAATQQRVGVLEKAIAAGKHVYSEKPVAPTVAQGLALLQQMQTRAGSSTARSRTRSIFPACRSSRASCKAASSAASSDSGSNSAGGCSTAATSRASGRAGTIAPAAAA